MTEDYTKYFPPTNGLGDILPYFDWTLLQLTHEAEARGIKYAGLSRYQVIQKLENWDDDVIDNFEG